MYFLVLLRGGFKADAPGVYLFCVLAFWSFFEFFFLFAFVLVGFGLKAVHGLGIYRYVPPVMLAVIFVVLAEYFFVYTHPR